MGFGPVVNMAGGYLLSLISGAMHGSNSNTTTSAGAASTSGTAGNTQNANQLSPFAQILSSLQQLEQSNPSQYQQVTQQIANNLQTASQSATAAGNAAVAGRLTQLSTDFRNASTSGQLPNVSDLAQAIGGGHHHHRHGRGAGNVNEFLQSLNAPQSGAGGSNSLSALSIIDNTLSSAGIPIS
jgi:hypothetical protein